MAMTRVSSIVNIAVGAVDRDDVRDLVFSPDGHNRGCLGIIFGAQAPWVMKIQDGKRIEVPVTKPVTSLAFRPTEKSEVNGERSQEVAFAYGHDSAKVEIYDIGNGEWLAPIFFPRAQALRYSEQGDRLAIGSSTGRVAVYSFERGQRKETCDVQVSRSAIVRLAFSGLGESLWALTARGEVYRIEKTTGQSTFQGTAFQAAQEVGRELSADEIDFDCWAHGFHREAQVAAFAGSAGKSGSCKVYLVNLENGRRRTLETGHGRYIRRVQFIGAQQLAVFGDQGCEIWNLSTQVKCRFEPTGDVLGLAFTAMQFGDSAIVAGV